MTRSATGTVVTVTHALPGEHASLEAIAREHLARHGRALVGGPRPHIKVDLAPAHRHAPVQDDLPRVNGGSEGHLLLGVERRGPLAIYVDRDAALIVWGTHRVNDGRLWLIA